MSTPENLRDTQLYIVKVNLFIIQDIFEFQSHHLYVEICNQ